MVPSQTRDRNSILLEPGVMWDPPGPTHTNQIVNRWRHNLDFYKVASSVPVVKLLRTGGRGLPRDGGVPNTASESFKK